MKLYQAEVYNRGAYGTCFLLAESYADAVQAVYQQCKIGTVTFLRGRVGMANHAGWDGSRILDLPAGVSSHFCA